MSGETISQAPDAEPMPQGFSIAIDGPVASGKGTLAAALAEKLDGININTGSMYRAVALLSLERGLNVNDESQVSVVLPETKVNFRDGKVFLGERDITERVKEPDTTHGSSVVATYPSVREDLVRKQQEIAREGILGGHAVIAEGRDIGTRVLPGASMKLFLTATPEIRAKRRQQQYNEQGIEKTFEEMLADVKERDGRDMGRKVDPLPSNPAELGYFVLDDSDQTEEETIQAVINELKRRGLLND